jgi:DNA-damage-inducible protein J
MAQTNINIRMDENLKRDFDSLCNDLGLTMTAAFNVFAKTVVRQQRIPFEISMDVPNAGTTAALGEPVSTLQRMDIDENDRFS